MSRPFLTAEWKHLCLITYAVPAGKLQRVIPRGLDLDQKDGQAFVSLVAFQFVNTRVFGIAWPGFRGFPELNLRTYVRQGNERGVLFLREIVPSRLVSSIAHRFYNEPYVAAPLTYQVHESAAEISAHCQLNWAGRQSTFSMVVENRRSQPLSGSREHYFKEHQWGYGRDRRGWPTRFEVIHPVWEIAPVKRIEMNFDFACVYGQEWAVLNRLQPCSVMFALGSYVEVLRAQICRPLG